jgi:hypothetical protein
MFESNSFFLRFLRKRSARIGLGGILAIAVAVAGWRLLGPDSENGIMGLRLSNPSSVAVRQRAIRALEQKDAKTLVALADREEVLRLNLSPDVVDALLRETLWKEGTAKQVGTTRRLQAPPDYANYEIHFSSVGGAPQRFYIVTIDTPGIGWKLNLSSTLRSTCYWKFGGQGGAAAYRELARKHGITGLREQSGDYVTIQRLEERTAAITQAEGK